MLFTVAIMNGTDRAGHIDRLASYDMIRRMRFEKGLCSSEQRQHISNTCKTSWFQASMRHFLLGMVGVLITLNIDVNTIGRFLLEGLELWQPRYAAIWVYVAC